MRILGHIHTFNDEEVIDRCLRALLDQTYPVDEVLIVDNASTDGTLSRIFPHHVTVIRQQENQGTSGAVATGFQYAIDHGFDWIWIFDADSAPRRDALETLIHFYDSLPVDAKETIWWVAGMRLDLETRVVHHVAKFTRSGVRKGVPRPGEVCYEGDVTIWSGSLFKLALAKTVGLPSRDYRLDWGEFEYCYRGKRRGYRGFVHPGSIIDHNIGGQPSVRFTSYRLGPLSFKLMEFPPVRCYYFTRNLVYFWLYEYHVRSLATLTFCLRNVAKMTLPFLLRPLTHRSELLACLRGIRDGVLKRIGATYDGQAPSRTLDAL